MKFIKKVLVSFFILILVSIGIVACSFGSSSNNFSSWIQSDRPRVLCTTAIIEDLTHKIGHEKISCLSLITGEMDPHSYEIVKGDDEKFSMADLVISNGLALEHSASMQYQLQTHKNLLPLGDFVKKERPDEIIYIDGQVDPHIWMDFSLWSACVDLVADELTKLLPEEKNFFEARAVEVKQEFSKADKKLYEIIQSIPEKKRYLVSSHDAFNYYVRRYFSLPNERDLNGEIGPRMRALQGLAPDEQINPLDIKRIADHIVEHEITIIFPEANLSQDSLRKVVDATVKNGRQVELCEEALLGDTLGGKTYVDMMFHNADVLKRHLSN